MHVMLLECAIHILNLVNSKMQIGLSMAARSTTSCEENFVNCFLLSSLKYVRDWGGMYMLKRL